MQRPSPPPRRALLLAALALAPLAACVTRAPAAAAPEPVEALPLRWPARTGQGLDELADDLPRDERRTLRVAGFFDGRFVGGTIESPVRVLSATPARFGLLRELVLIDPATGAPVPEPPILEFVTRGGGSAPEPGDPHRVELAVLEPLGEPRGLVVHLEGLGSSERESAVTDLLRARGWLVLRGELPWGLFERQVVDAHDEADLEAAAEMLAERMDGRLANWALGVEAAVAHVRARWPDLPPRVVLIGFSAGAMGAVTAAARLGPELDALVVVGGGANLMWMARHTVLNAADVEVLWRGAPPPEEVGARLDALYLAAARLDPFHAAPWVRGLPVLMVQARHDRIVPRAAGELLHRRLGSPERWTLPGGHKVLFWRLPRLADDLVEWIGAQVLEPAAPAPEPHPR